MVSKWQIILRSSGEATKRRTMVSVALVGCLLVFSATVDAKTGVEETFVDSVTPTYGSLNGETRLTIYGKGFADSEFNQVDDKIGNLVHLVSDTEVVLCRTHKDGTHSTQIMCYTPNNLREDTFNVRVSVDGERVPDSQHCPNKQADCRFHPRSGYTPSVSQVLPLASLPKSILQVNGKMFTDKFVTAQAAACNGKEERILRVYFNNQLCELRVPGANDKYYGLGLDNNCRYSTHDNSLCLAGDCDSDWGYFKCVTQGSYVGNQNGSFIISGQYGRSQPDLATKKVMALGDIAMFQTFAEITGLSTSTGSTVGGLRLTIYGRFFDETDAPAEVIVAGEKCQVIEVNDGSIICTVPRQPASLAYSFPGNRGALLEVFNETGVTNLGLDAITNFTIPGRVEERDDMSFTQKRDEPNTANFFSTRQRGFLVPPEDNEYRFYLTADDSAQLYLSNSTDPADKQLVASCSVYRGSFFEDEEQRSERMFLTGGQPYYYELNHIELNGNAAVDVAMHMFHTSYTADMAGNARNERQLIQTVSVVYKETVGLTLKDWGSSSTRAEVQRVEVTAPSDMAMFRLGMHGAYTEALAVTSPATTVSTALGKLISIKPYSASVSSTAITGGTRYTITMNGDGGNWPDFQVISAMTSAGEIPVTSSVTEITAGIASMNDYRLDFGGHPSPVISKVASAEQVANVITDMFSVLCPTIITSPPSRARHYNYEEPTSGVSGTRVSDIRPFCGRYSLRNPGFLFLDDNYPINAKTRGKLCFAYRGNLQQRLLMYHHYTLSDGSEKTQWIALNAELPVKNGWGYACFDLYAMILARYPTVIADEIFRLVIYKEATETEFHVDEVYIGGIMLVESSQYDSLASYERLAPPRWVTESVDVEGSGSDFNVTYTTINCDYNLPLLGVGHAQLQSGSANSAVYRDANWAAGANIAINRYQVASPPIGGTFDLYHGSQPLLGVASDIDAATLKAKLETLSGVGTVNVERTGSCEGYAWHIDYVTGGAGDQPDLTADLSGLTGTDVDITASTLTDGGVFFNPIIGDMLRTYHETPQVRVNINGIPSKCSDDCSFEWSSSATPTATSISPSTGVYQDTITITGTGFDPDNTTVMIGGVECDITSGSDTQLQCSAGKGPTGLQDVVVNIANKGDADETNGDLTFTFQFTITSVSPTSGSTAGGSDLTLTGTGFGDNMNVTIDGDHCVISAVSYTSLRCSTPTLSAGTYDVIGTDGASTVTASDRFTSDASLTPTVSSLSASAALVEGGTVITLTGSAFGSDLPSDDAVTLGGKSAAISSWADTEIVVELPALGPGSYPLDVILPDGKADITAVSDITYSLEVTAVSPEYGSQQGGTLLTLTGQGFSVTTEVNEVAVGGVACEVLNATDTEIICRTGTSATQHKIDNLGTHITYGRGYAWSKNPITVAVGDSIRWTWNTPELINGISYKVEQTANETANEYAGSGFRSGTSSRAGVFVYKFSNPGTYYYWSGCVDTSCKITMRGTIIVVDAESIAGQLSLSIGDYEAVYSTGSVSGTTSNVCSVGTGAITGCSDTLPSGGDASKFFFSYWACATPYITDMDPLMGTSLTVINIDGDGFGSADCQNEVTVGGEKCVIIASSDKSINCTVDPADKLQVGVPYEVDVVVNNRGSALNTIEDDLARRFVLLPHVMTVTPNSGSTAGGTRLTIDGDGFSSDTGSTTVTILGSSCVIESLTYDRIICITSNAWAGDDDVTITVFSNGNPVQAECGGSCEFTYDSDITPVVGDISPTVISTEGTIITFTGSNFGTDANMLDISVGDTLCTPVAVADTEVTCNAGAPVVGWQTLGFRLDNVGQASLSSSVIRVDDILTSVEPTSGSVVGGTILALTGLGFSNDSIVDVSGNPCQILSVNSTEIQCVSPSSGNTTINTTADITVTSNSITYSTTLMFDYSLADTPEITSVAPSSGAIGDSVTISGSGFGSVDGDVTVMVDDVECAVTAVTDTSIVCTVGTHAAGTYGSYVNVAGKGSAAGGADNPFTYELNLDSISPSTGSYGGGQSVVLSGDGFSDTITQVTICDSVCDIIGSPTTSEIECVTPSMTSGSTDVCDVIVKVGGVNTTSAGAYTYDSSLTATISSVEPIRGGTGGGTSVTVTGSGFGSDVGALNVTIAGSDCSIDSLSNTEIVCTTGAHKPSVKAKVRVEVSTNGIAMQDNADFQYIDVWSSNFTWGGLPPPEEGTLVVIPDDMTVLLDVDTPVFAMIIIQGQLIFDEVDVELQAEKILITDGGLLQVGTEDEPFQHRAIITMHGHVLSKELPIYGTKTIAVRNGSIELHGKPVGQTWTVLDSTAQAGDDTITLMHPVEWNVGDEVVIASTGDRHSQIQNEVKVISAISSDKMTLTLSEALGYKHLGETITYGDYTLEARAEVGLLSRNILVRGSDNVEWHDEIERCEAGFDTGEFATQTCFQGRFGEEIGNDQFGAAIMLHGPEEGLVIGHIENIEMNYVGQAFRLGRYAIHFHLNGDMTGSYVRSCAIHQSFNRAVNVHATHNLIVEHNVIYNIMGGAFFTEDGVETGNFFQYNLAVFVKSSTSLQNDDITPAAFWVTNPNNTLRHNHAVGGTHFGFWYRMHSHPDGPSFDPNICPQKVPLGIFYNNTVHSQGWFGVWIFQHFYPTVGGSCHGTEVVPAVFDGFTAWNCEKGAETVGGGAIQYKNFKFVNNDKAGYEFKLANVPSSAEYNDNAPMLAHGLIAGDGGGVMDDYTTTTGVILPYNTGFVVNDVTFVNFASSTSAFGVTSIDGKTQDHNGGFTYHTANLTFDNVDHYAAFRWPHECVYHDLDGTLTGIAGGKVVADDPALPPSCSISGSDVFNGNPSYPGSVCQADVKFIRYSFNNPVPQSLAAKNVSFTNQYGTSLAQYKPKRVTHKLGWMVLLVNKETYFKEFINAGHITNISYTGKYYGFETKDYLLMKHNFTQRADRFEIFQGVQREEASEPLTRKSHNGEWFFHDDETIFEFAMSSRSESNPDGVIDGRIDIGVQLKVYQCFYEDCIPPPDESDVPPPDQRPDDAVFWSDPDAWDFSEEGYGSYYGPGSYGLPKNDTDVKIPAGVWMVADTVLPRINKLFIEGVLEFEHYPINGDYMDLTLSATHILISNGRLIVGWENHPFQANAVIELRGDHLTPELPLPYGPNLGAKALGVFGGLDLHGLPHNITWTQLSATAVAGSDTIILKDMVDWLPGNEIVIATTSFQFRETEVRVIASVNGNTVQLTRPLEHDHKAGQHMIAPGRSYPMAAEVGLLSRNVRVVGQDYPKLQEQAFGARLLVGTYEYEHESGYDVYTGYARISEVEFYHAGQEGFVDSYDPRFALSFLDTGDTIPARPSYVHNCAFNDGFSPALGVFGASGLNITDNVVYSTVGPAFIVQGADHVVDHNLATRTLFPGTFNGRQEERIEFDASFEIQGSTRMRFTNNHAAGSERAGIRTDGERCPSDSSQDLYYSNNVAHSSLIGVMVMLGDGLAPCSVLANFTVYRNWDCGLYFQTEASVKVQGLISIDNNVGLYPMVIRPPATSHGFVDKFIEVRDSVFVGNSDLFDCADSLSNNDPVLSTISQARSWRSPSNGKVGVALPTFSSGGNNMPEKPFFNIMAYNAIRGVMRMTGTTFTDFATSCGDRKDIAVTPNPNNEDAIHPTEVSSTTFLNTDEDHKIYLFRPNVGKINPADCVDMDCDGMKKAMVNDLDGSFLGISQPGTIIPESEYEWDGDPRRGYGDYRIPKTMLTYPNGSRIDVNVKCPHKGIYRDNTCTYRTAYQSYVCHGPDYNMLMLESMDSDTETRRVSPVGVLAGGYIDLINGPQDHGWCMGYTCQKRVSLFPILLASGKEYDIHFTGTTPQNLRYHWLTTDDASVVLVGVWYSQPWRLDVFQEGIYMMPENAAYNSNGQLILESPPANDPRYYMPDLSVAPAGSNYYDRASQVLWLVLRGSTLVDVKTAELVIVTFDVPAMSVDDFFGENLVANIAAFLNIPPEKIRVAQAVAESRRKRDIDAQSVTVTISNPPRNDSEVDPSDLSTDQIYNISSYIVTTYQLGGLGSALNITILSISVIEPPPQTDSDSWRILAELETSSEVELQLPDQMDISDDIISISEGSLFSSPPAVHIIDPYGLHVRQLGSLSDPWRLNASLIKLNDDRSDSRATLVGSYEIPFVLGWANFTDLRVSHSGDYMLAFGVVYPTGAAHFTQESVTFTVPVRQLSGQVVAYPNDTFANELISLEVEIIDAITGEKVEEVDWKGHTYMCDAALHRPEIYHGTLNGSLVDAAIEVTSGMALYDDLTFSQPGKYYIAFHCVSTPAQYDFTFVSEVLDILPQGYMPPEIEMTVRVTLRFDGDYAVVAYGEEVYLGSALYNFFFNKYPGVIHRNHTIYQGSIMVDFNMDGPTANITDVLNSIWEDLKGPLVISYKTHSLTAYEEMWVEGISFYGLDGPQAAPSGGGLEAWIIALVAVLVSLVILMVVGGVAFYKYKFRGEEKNKITTVSPVMSNVELRFNTPTSKKMTLMADPYLAIGFRSYEYDAESNPSSSRPSTSSRPTSTSIIIPQAAPQSTTMISSRSNSNLSRSGTNVVQPLPGFDDKIPLDQIRLTAGSVGSKLPKIKKSK